MADPSASTLDLLSPEACVICLSCLSERSIALPCKHDQFDFSCLCTWLHEKPVCPLCKIPVTAVKYDLSKPHAGTIFTLPRPDPASPAREGQSQRAHPYQRRNDSYRRSFGCSNGSPLPRTRVSPSFRLDVEALMAEKAIALRQRVYRKQMYSLRVGSNPISRYKNFTPQSLTSNEMLVSRAKRWIRRELSAFKFLDPSSASYGNSDRRTSNAEFLLEYVVSILKSIDLRGSGGQAEELLKDFLGQENTRLFLHELEAFLRSPYEKPEDWDKHVQYAEVQASRSRRKANYNCSDTEEDTLDSAISGTDL